LRTNAYAFKGLRSERAHTGTKQDRHDGGAQKDTFPHMYELSGEVASEVRHNGFLLPVAPCNEAESDRPGSRRKDLEACRTTAHRPAGTRVVT